MSRPAEQRERCCCGLPLHYNSIDVYFIVEDLVQKLGPTILVTLPGHYVSYRVPRHYIALHGLLAQELAELAERYNWEVVP